jgi:hypothetical protein
MLIARIGVAPCDRKGATEKNIERIAYIEGDEVLGYSGRGREEHSGEPVATGTPARQAASPRPAGHRQRAARAR